MLCALFLSGRMAMDIAGALFLLYAKLWLGRVDDFELVMLIFFGASLLSFPLAVRLARHREKSRLVAVGALGWIALAIFQLSIQPDWPRWIFFVVIPLTAPALAIVDVLPWSMVGEVADEGELANGQRRDGAYNGILSFVRKLGGAIGVFLVLAFLDVMGFVEGSETQTETARQAVRVASSLGPAIPLAFGVWLALRYPLRRSDHARIRAALDTRADVR